MSRWTEAFMGHAIHKQLEDLSHSLAETPYPTTAPDDGHNEVARLRKVLAFTESHLKGLDPDIAPPNLPASLQAPLNNIQSQISNFFSNGNIGHMQNANAHADSLLSTLASQTCISFSAASTSLKEAATAYQETLENSAKDARTKLGELLRLAENDFEKFKQSEAESIRRLERIETRLNELDNQVGGQLTGYNTAFQSSENTRGERFEKWMQGYDKKLDDAFVAYTLKAGTATQAIDNLQLQAGKVLGSVVDTSQAGAYATYATEEKKSANLYRRLSLSLMTLAALVLFVPEIAQAMHSGLTYTIDWEKALPRLPFSLVLFAPALYLARESSRHRTNEITNRRRQHILTTIGPYLALLPNEKAEEIKAQVAKSIFSEGVSTTDEKASETSNLLAQLANLVGKLKL